MVALLDLLAQHGSQTNDLQRTIFAQAKHILIFTIEGDIAAIQESPDWSRDSGHQSEEIRYLQNALEEIQGMEIADATTA